MHCWWRRGCPRRFGRRRRRGGLCVPHAVVADDDLLADAQRQHLGRPAPTAGFAADDGAATAARAAARDLSLVSLLVHVPLQCGADGLDNVLPAVVFRLEQGRGDALEFLLAIVGRNPGAGAERGGCLEPCGRAEEDVATEPPGVADGVEAVQEGCQREGCLGDEVGRHVGREGRRRDAVRRVKE